jgi:hypothetical protein
MKTAELTGAALNWAVAQCEGLNPLLASSFEDGHADAWGCPFVYLHEPMKNKQPFAAPPFYMGFNPSTNWLEGGAIIEREKIALHFNGDSPWVGECGWARRDGATPLEAAMRSYVAVKLGDDIEIPEELIK